MNDTPTGAGASEQPHTPPTAPEPVSAPETAAPAPSSVNASPSILDRLRKQFAEGEQQRTKVFAIAPGRYSDMAARYHPLDWDLRRKLSRRYERTGLLNDEANLTFQATLMADACESILIRPAPGKDYVEAHTLPELASISGGQIIRYDSRLAAILDMHPPEGADAATICRLVFGEAGPFELHMQQLSAWSTLVAPDEDDDDEEEGVDRPT